jgi:hypothetical protein
MKKIARYTFVLIAAMVISPSLRAEDISKKERLPENSSKLSMTFFMTSFPNDSSSKKVANAADQIVFSDKYFNHNLESLNLSIDKEFYTLTANAKRKYLRDQLEKEGIGRKMVAKWFNKQEDGTMNLDYVHKCGTSNARNQNVRISEAKRGDAFLKEAGQDLINKTYVMILVPGQTRSKDDGKSRSWETKYDLYLYKLLFTTDVIANFYNVWSYEDDDASVIQKKKNAFNSMNFKFADVYSIPSQSASATVSLENKKKPKSMDQLMDEMVNHMYENSILLVDKNIEELQGMIKVSKLYPIRGTAGKKEGLKCDQQFFVYQYEWKDQAAKAVPKRKAVVRSTNNIFDNTRAVNGSSPESNFYQTYGSPVQEGMVLEHKGNLGLSVVAGYEGGNIGGANLNLMLRTGILTGITSFYLMLDFGFDSKEYTPISFPSQQYSFTRYSAGLGKGLRLARIVELTPFAQYGIEKTKSNAPAYRDLSTTFIKGGGMLGINLLHNLMLVGQTSYYLPFGDIKIKDSNGLKSTMNDSRWDKAFANRKGISVMGGIRFEF